MNPVRPEITKGTIARIEANNKMARPYVFQFNPTKLSRKRNAVWVDLNAPGTSGGMAMFVRVDSQEITLELFLAHFRASNLTLDDTCLQSDLAEIESWGLPALDTFLSDQYQFIPPPRLIFSYGSRVWYCTARNIQIEELEHNNKLYPTRAKVTLTLKTDSQTFEDLMAEMTWYRNVRGVS